MAATGYTSGDPRKVDTAGDAMTGELTLPDSSPDTALTAATRGYVDNSTASASGNILDYIGERIAELNEVYLALSGGTVNGNLTEVGDFLVRNAGTTKAYRFRTSGGALDTEAGGSDWYISMFPDAEFDPGEQINYLRFESGVAILHVLAEVQFKAAAFGPRVHTLDGKNGLAGFFGANPVARPSVTGSWSDGSAGDSLAAALALLGLITDGTTP